MRFACLGLCVQGSVRVGIGLGFDLGRLGSIGRPGRIGRIGLGHVGSFGLDGCRLCCLGIVCCCFRRGFLGGIGGLSGCPVTLRPAAFAAPVFALRRGILSRLRRLGARRRCRRQRGRGRLRGGGHHADLGCRDRGCSGLELLALRRIDRGARLGGQLRQLCGKGHRCRRRCGAGDDASLMRRRLVAGLAGTALHALVDRCHVGDAHHGRAGDRFARQVQFGLGHRQRAHEGLRRHRDHSARDLLVDVDHLGDLGNLGRAVDDGRVVDIGDRRRRDHRIAAIDALEVGAADRVGRLIDLARRQREPADLGCARAAGRHRDLEVRAANEGHQRRRIHRPLTSRAGNPGPCAADVRPATIVRHGIAPGRVVHPGPAPGVDP